MPNTKTKPDISQPKSAAAEEHPSRLTRSRAIRLKCLDCMCGNRAEVRRCPSVDCPLYRYRMGKEIRGTDDTEDCEESENEADADDFSENNEEED